MWFENDMHLYDLFLNKISVPEYNLWNTCSLSVILISEKMYNSLFDLI